MNTKTRWSNKERTDLLLEVKRQHEKHPTMRTLDLVRIAQKIALPSSRRRELTGTQQVEWIDEERDKWIAAEKNYVPIAERPIFVEELPPPTPKQDWKELLSDMLADAMVQIFAEAIVKARQRLDLPVVDIQPHHHEPEKKHLKKIAVYGLIPTQEKDVRKALDGCFEFRFLKDVNQHKLVSAAQWADSFYVMTKFVSHDYEAVKKYKNVIYSNGAASALIADLEAKYLEESKENL
jgi:hypothetical protein